MIRCVSHGTGTLAVLVLSLLVTGMSGKPQTLTGKAPDINLKNLSGEIVTLEDYRGKPVLLHFWATWCKPCVKELPEIEAAWRDLHDEGFVVLAVDVGEEQGIVQTFVKRLDLTFPVLLDQSSSAAHAYNIIGLPVSFFIDKNGMISEQLSGGTLTRESLAQRVKGRDTGSN